MAGVIAFVSEIGKKLTKQGRARVWVVEGKSKGDRMG